MDRDDYEFEQDHRDWNDDEGWVDPE